MDPSPSKLWGGYTPGYILIAMDTLRKPKVFDIAVFDVLATAGGAYIIGRAMHINFLASFIILLIAGAIMHWTFGIKTKGNYYLGIGEDPRPSTR